MRALKWKQFAPEGEGYHVARALFQGRDHSPLHRQDYAEIFWLEQGQCRHDVNGVSCRLARGDVVFVRCEDRHALHTVDGARFVLVNLAFPAETLAHLRARYFGEETRYFWHTGTLPYVLRVADDQLAEMGYWARQLDRSARLRVEGDRVLLNLLHMFESEPDSWLSLREPPWLVQALAGMENPELLRGGTAALARLAGRTPEHVNATLKAQLGRTATEVVNLLRMRYAGAQLRMGTQKILEICYDCGWENLGHFYKLFKAQYGMTPRDYRLHHRSTITSTRFEV